MGNPETIDFPFGTIEMENKWFGVKWKINGFGVQIQRHIRVMLSTLA